MKWHGFRCIILQFLFAAAWTATLPALPVQSPERQAIATLDADLGIALQSLVPDGSAPFPHNIIVTIPAESTQIFSGTLVFSFTQEFAAQNAQFINDLAHGIAATPHGIPVCLLLGADSDQADTLFTDDTRLTGSEVFAQNAEDTDATYVIVFSQADGGMHLVPGAGGTVSPLWLARAVTAAAQAQGLGAEIPGTKMLPYRLGLAGGSARLGRYLAEGIPATEVQAAATQETLAWLTGCVDFVEEELSYGIEPDTHYGSLRVGNAVLWLSETFLIVGHVAILALMLLTLAFASFSSRGRSSAFQKDFARTWYMMPLTVGATVAFLSLSQLILAPAAQAGAVRYFGLKIVLTCALMVVLLLLQVLFRFRFSFAVLGYETEFAAALCLIVFSVIDISLVFAFGLLYALTVFGKRLRNPVALMVMLLLTQLPLLPYLRAIVLLAPEQTLLALVRCKPWQNLLVALLLFVFFSQLMRIIIALRIFVQETRRSRKRTVVRIIVTAVVCVAVCALLFLLPAMAYARQRPEPEDMPDMQVLDDGTGFGAEVSRLDFLGMTTNQLTLTAQQGVYRYDVRIQGTSDVPLYESNFAYTLYPDGTARFRLPDWPGSRLNILYSTGDTAPDSITVDAYIVQDDGTLAKSTRHLAP